MLLPVYLFLFVELALVSYLDIKYRKIKNIWSLLNIIVAIILFGLYPQSYPLSVEMFQFAMVFIVVGFGLFMLKIMGGGDSKFLATFFLLVPLDYQEIVFYYLLIFTIIIGVIKFFHSVITNYSKLVEGFQTKNMVMIKSCFGTKFAYAPVIFLTWVWMGWILYLK